MLISVIYCVNVGTRGVYAGRIFYSNLGVAFIVTTILNASPNFKIVVEMNAKFQIGIESPNVDSLKVVIHV